MPHFVSTRGSLSQICARSDFARVVQTLTACSKASYLVMVGARLVSSGATWMPMVVGSNQDPATLGAEREYLEVLFPFSVISARQKNSLYPGRAVGELDVALQSQLIESLRGCDFGRERLGNRQLSLSASSCLQRTRELGEELVGSYLKAVGAPYWAFRFRE
jgi:hypothetical protein